MSRVRANKLSNRAGSGAPELSYGAEVPVGYGITGAGGVNIAGVATAGGFVGNLTGNVTGNADSATSATSATSAAALTGTPDITVRNVTGVAGTFTGFVAFSTSISVGGTITYEDVTNIDSVGIVTARNLVDAQGGINATGIITARAGTAVTFQGGVNVYNARERVATGATSHYITDKSVTLELDCLQGTVFTHSLANGNVGIVSIKNFPVEQNSFHTVTIIFDQNTSAPSGGIGNTMVDGIPSGFPGGIGTHIRLTPRGVAGFNTDARIGSATTVTLSNTARDTDIISIGIHYNGGTNTNAQSYKPFITKNGGFAHGDIAI
jgi:hypothetical protein|tara:strand:- start:773 stop:1738 length:966 start_codon:yes stop_codon:yes gene_type:complete